MNNTAKKIVLLAALFFIIVKIIIVVAIFNYPTIAPDANLSVNVQELIDMTNNYRASQGLSSLTINPRLTQAAVNKASDILSKQYFNHTSPEGKKFSDWIREVGYKYFYVGENLAIDFDNNKDIFEAWLDSPTHKENIDKPQYQEIGIAALNGKYKNRPSTVVVQLFGTRILSDDDVTTPFAVGELTGAESSFYPIETVTSLENLERANDWNNLLLIIVMAVFIVFYYPRPSQIQAKSKKPITKR